MPYFSNKKDIAKSNRFELHEPRGTVSEFFTTIREKIVSGVGGLNTKYVQKNWTIVTWSNYTKVIVEIQISMSF